MAFIFEEAAVKFPVHSFVVNCSNSFFHLQNSLALYDALTLLNPGWMKHKKKTSACQWNNIPLNLAQ